MVRGLIMLRRVMKGEERMANYIPPKTISFPSDIHGVRIHEGKEQVRVLCSDNQYHWVDYNRYRSRKE